MPSKQTLAKQVSQEYRQRWWELLVAILILVGTSWAVHRNATKGVNDRIEEASRAAFEAGVNHGAILERERLEKLQTE